MQIIDRKLLSQLVGGSSAAANLGAGSFDGGVWDSFDGGGGGGGGWGSFDGGGGGWGSLDGGGGSGVTFGGDVSIEGWQGAVVTVSGSHSDSSLYDFDNTPAVSIYGAGEAPWEGQYLGHWVDAAPLSYEHSAVDGALISGAGRVTGTAASAFTQGALTGAGVGAETANPFAVLAGLVVGGLAAAGSYRLIERDHPTGHFE
jgi:hypothetical protein